MSHWAYFSQPLVVFVSHWSICTASNRNLFVWKEWKIVVWCSLMAEERSTTIFCSFQHWDFCCLLSTLINSQLKRPVVRRSLPSVTLRLLRILVAGVWCFSHIHNILSSNPTVDQQFTPTLICKQWRWRTCQAMTHPSQDSDSGLVL